MNGQFFVLKDSVVREIWGKGDTILMIFAGASAEFALNKAVDWLYYTGRLPGDSFGRLFSTVSCARQIVFAEKQPTLNAIEKMNRAHSAVESKRGISIPDWAYRDVLFMPIDYSIRSFEILERKLTICEKEDVFKVFREVGINMHIKELPVTYGQFENMRKLHLEQHLYNGDYTKDLYCRYRKHLGFIRYRILLETQIVIVPNTVRKLLAHRSFSLLGPVISAFKLSRDIHVDNTLRSPILPSAYKGVIRSLDHFSV
ncbi:DUF2236 domain-containing protein [Pricia sp.]|uniref:DUF2236 domain-containing protein n=1 Tax=Pricia sp. TaxID=2268138 RepID=UPI00359470F2